MKEIVFNQEKNTRIDKYLKEKLNVSREKIKYLIKQEKVIVNSKKIIPSYHLKKGDLISIIQIEEEEKEEIKPEKSSLEIIYEDKNIIVVNKPAGIITHPTNYKKTGTLLNYVLYLII